MTAGLVSNVALESLAVLRSNTYPLLTKLHKGLDAPYLTQRALLTQPNDASESLVSIVAAELLSVLEEYDVGAKAGPEAIMAWLRSRCPEDNTFRISNQTLSVEEMQHLLVNGGLPSKSDKENEKFRHKVFKELTRHFCLVI